MDRRHRQFVLRCFYGAYFHVVFSMTAKVLVDSDLEAARFLKCVAKAVATRRTELGLSQQELAARSGLHRAYISDLERGARNISLINTYKLALALELSPSRLIDLGESNM